MPVARGPLRAGIAPLLAAVLVVAAGRPVPAAERITVGITSLSPGTMPLYAAKEKGFFEAEGLAVELVVFRSGTENAQAILANEVQIGIGNILEVFTIRKAGQDARYFWSVANLMPYRLYARPEVQGPGDLKGKKLAISKFGAQTDYLTRHTLRHFGIEPIKDAAILQIGSTPARYAAMKAGAVDATIMWFPQILVAEHEGFRRLADLAEIFPDWAYMGYFAKADLLRAQRDRTERFLRAHTRGLQLVQRNPEAGIAILQRYLKYERPVAEAGYREFSRSLAADGRIPAKGIEFLVAEELKAGNLKERYAAGDLMDTSFIEQFARAPK
jgi:NitT/TauT family transport system substrate-binding protein